MRTAMPPSTVQVRLAIRRWTSIAAATAAEGDANATPNESPAFANTTPSFAENTERMRSSCAARSTCMLMGSSAHNLVDPTMSEKRNTRRTRQR